MAFNEDNRVKIPALIHLTRLGYDYFSPRTSNHTIDKSTNIITDIFESQLKKLNPKATDEQIAQELTNIQQELGNNDLGREFYKRLTGIESRSSLKLIDWNNFDNNRFNITTELPCVNGEDEFRPDITVFINGLPLAFIEVKKPNNPEGIKAERDRINDRFRNEKFRKFINITQLLVFSNNMEYDDADQSKLIGAFYATTAKGYDTKFNHFREQRQADFIDSLAEINESVEDFILTDNNARVIKHDPEFKTNKDTQTPTNRILSSLFHKDRLRYLLKYAICYVEESEDTGEISIQKHIMRYPQFFASRAITAKLDEGATKGVIWHTQGSGKTALSFYSVRVLKDYFATKGVVPKFYFVVDRLDLATQAKDEFSKRGLTVHSIDSKDALLSDFKYNATNEGITVLNIHKFREDTLTLRDSGYSITVQKVFFIDEAHRSYDPKGSFLANLYNSDKESIKIALTGTPLIIYRDHDEDGNIKDSSKKEISSTTRGIFGDYIHKYYYNDSIRDGYTLKLLREEIETTYKEKVQRVMSVIKVQFGDINKKELYAHEKFVEPMLHYIIKDFTQSRVRFGDKTIGGMVVCDSSEQAREMFHQFNEQAGEHKLTSALILWNEDDKETRKAKTKDFRDGKIDLLFVYSMLLTGFDAPRLKKLYLGRKIRAHNLLQTLTRVNRPFKSFKLGYVVDFADISAEFEVTNQAYFRELNEEYKENLDGEDTNDIFGSLFMSQSEIDQKIAEVQLAIADYSTDNLETFSSQISQIDDKTSLNQLRKSLESAREVYNVARLLGYTEILNKLDFRLLTKLLTMVSDRIKLLNLRDASDSVNSQELLNTAIEDVVFTFTKTGEEELKILSQDLHSIAGKVRSELDKNFNHKDPEWLELYQAFIELLNKHHIDPASESLETMKFESAELKSIFDRIRELNRCNSMLVAKFEGDRKFAIVYKNVQPSGRVSDNLPLYNLLSDVKTKIDNRLMLNQNLLQNTGFFRQEVGTDIVDSYEANGYKVDIAIIDKLVENITDQYLNEYQGDQN